MTQHVYGSGPFTTMLGFDTVEVDESAYERLENPRKTMGKWWFNGIYWELPNLVMTNSLQS